MPAPDFSGRLLDLFDERRRLRPFDELSSELQGQIKTFEIRRTRMRRQGETVITEELIRVTLRDGRTAKQAIRGGSYASGKIVALQVLSPRLVTTIERNVGGGQTEAAATIDAEIVDVGELGS